MDTQKSSLDQIALVSYIDDLIKERTDLHYTQEELPVVKEALLKELNEAINTHLVKRLSENDQAALNILLDKNATDDELNRFFMDKIPDISTEISMVLLNFRATYLYPLTKNQTVNKEEIMPAPVAINN